MGLRSSIRCVLLVFALGALAGCEGSDLEYRLRLSIIELEKNDGPEDLGVGIHISAPDTIWLRQVATVSIRTYGNGCLRRSGEPHTFVEWRHYRHVILMPFDQFSYAKRPLAAPHNCADAGYHWTRDVSVVFRREGSAVITVRGISTHEYPEKVIDVVRPIEVVR